MNEQKKLVVDMYHSLCVAYVSARQFDSHLEADTIEDMAKRLVDDGYRKTEECENISENHPVDEFICSECGLITRENSRIEIDEDADGDESQYEFEFRFCPRCGRKVKEKE